MGKLEPEARYNAKARLQHELEKEGETMPKCPKCGKGVDYLRNYSLHWTEHKFTVSKDGLPSYAPSDNIVMSDPVKNEYVCPECDATLFKSEGKALAFMKPCRNG